VFKAVKRLAVSVAIKSFVGRLSVIESLRRSGKMSDVEYELQKQQIISEYQKYLADVPSDLVPDWAKKIG
jgi:hypothetical protein